MVYTFFALAFSFCFAHAGPKIFSNDYAVPLDWTTSGSPTIGLEYAMLKRPEIQGSRVKNALIFLPGGPGNSSDTSFLGYGFPALANLANEDTVLIYTSPRGANRKLWLTQKLMETYPADYFSLDQQAHDLNALSLELKRIFPYLTKVWLYGHSHGGAVAIYTATHFPKEFKGIVLDNPGLGYDTPTIRLQSWLKEDEQLYNSYSHLIALAKEGLLTNSKGKISVFDVLAYTTVGSYFFSYPLAKESILSRPRIKKAIINCDIKNDCDFFTRSRDEIKRLQSTINNELENIIGCNELGGPCEVPELRKYKYKVPVSPYSAFEMTEVDNLKVDVVHHRKNKAYI